MEGSFRGAEGYRKSRNHGQTESVRKSMVFLFSGYGVSGCQPPSSKVRLLTINEHVCLSGGITHVYQEFQEPQEFKEH